MCDAFQSERRLSAIAAQEQARIDCGYFIITRDPAAIEIAVCFGFADVVHAAILSGLEFCDRDISMAASLKHLAVLRVLLDNIAAKNTWRDFETAVPVAIRFGFCDIVDRAITSGVDFSEDDFFYAALCGQLGVVRVLAPVFDRLDAETVTRMCLVADLDCIKLVAGWFPADFRLNSAILPVIEHGRFDVFRFLVDVGFANTGVVVACHSAILAKQPKFLKYLLETFPFAIRETISLQVTAVNAGSVPCMKILVDASPVRCRNAVLLALNRRDQAMMKFLVAEKFPRI